MLSLGETEARIVKRLMQSNTMSSVLQDCQKTSESLVLISRNSVRKLSYQNTFAAHAAIQIASCDRHLRILSTCDRLRKR